MTDDRDFRCDCQCHLPMGFYQPYLSPAPPAMRPCQLCIGSHERIAARWAMERADVREAEFLDELNHPHHVPPPDYRPPSVKDGTVSEGLISSLRYLIGEYGYAGVMSALEQLEEPEEKDSIGEAFKRGLDKGWRR